MNDKEENIDRAAIIKYLKERISSLEEEIKIYKAILSIMTSASEEIKLSKQTFTPDKVKVITVEDDVIANIVKLNNDIRIMLRETIPVDNEVFNSFLIPFLNDKKEMGEISNFDVKESRGFVTEIIVKGVKSEGTIKEIEIALKYLWKSLQRESK